MTPLEYLRDPKAKTRLRRAAYELCEGEDALRAEDVAEEACLREWATSDAAEIPLKTA
jgi:DNA-directed RNA polymerase specialized sigma24 family protein